jgi:hypothetical protein
MTESPPDHQFDAEIEHDSYVTEQFIIYSSIFLVSTALFFGTFYGSRILGKNIDQLRQFGSSLLEHSFDNNIPCGNRIFSG